MCGGGDTLNLPQINEDALLSQVKNRMNAGYDPTALNMWRQSGMNAIAGSQRAGMNAINSLGNNASLSGRLSGINKLYGDTAGQYTQLASTLANADETAKNQNFWAGAGLSHNIQLSDLQANTQNMLKQYEIDQSNRFSWGQLAGLLAQMGAQVGGAAIASDKRFKRNIHKIGSVKGVGFYEFDYVNGEHSIGVIAQDIDIPNAVTNKDGYLYVDYNKVFEYLK